MSITIYGAGAIGGLVGACMARAGEDVLLVDKVPEHVQAMNDKGLRISGFDNFTVRVRACLPADLRGPLGVTFLAVKSQDTEAALDVLTPLAGPETVVVSLQNGMNPPRLAVRLGAERVVAAFVSFPADWQEPGHIEHGGAGHIWVGELDGRITERLSRIQRLIAHAVGAHITDNIFGYLWAKQIDCSLLFAQAVTDEMFADVFGDKRYQPVLIALVGEGVERGAGGRDSSAQVRRVRPAQAAPEDAGGGGGGARGARPLRRLLPAAGQGPLGTVARPGRPQAAHRGGPHGRLGDRRGAQARDGHAS